MTARWLTLSILVFALLTQPMFLVGQASDNWAAVNALPGGTSIRVETKTGVKVDGKVEAVSDTTISLSGKKKTATFSRIDIKKVYRVDGGSRGKSAAIGTAVGAGIGAGLGVVALAATGGSDDTSGVLGRFIASGAGIGAALGAAFGGKKRTLVYESR